MFVCFLLFFCFVSLFLFFVFFLFEKAVCYPLCCDIYIYTMHYLNWRKGILMLKIPLMYMHGYCTNIRIYLFYSIYIQLSHKSWLFLYVRLTTCGETDILWKHDRYFSCITSFFRIIVVGRYKTLKPDVIHYIFVRICQSGLPFLNQSH